MSFLKKQSAGFYITILTAVLTVISIVFYLINCNTDYFANLGVNAGIVVCLVIAAVLEIVFVAGYNKAAQNRVMDIIPVVCGVLLMVAFVLFIGARVNSIATILSFEKNDQTMADLSSALIGMGFCFAAVLFNIIGSFFKVVKEEV